MFVLRNLRLTPRRSNISGPYQNQQRRSLFIHTKPTPNPESLQFFPEKAHVLPEGVATLDFPDSASTRTSPLARALFSVEGVKRVFFGPDFITITKTDQYEGELQGILFGAIVNFYASGEPVIVGSESLPKDTEILATDSETVALIKDLIDSRVRPGLQSDGGDIIYHGFVDGVIFVQLKGSCDGCPSSSGTLKNGIERMLKHWIPEVKGVMSVESVEEFHRLIEAVQSPEVKE